MIAAGMHERTLRACLSFVPAGVISPLKKGHTMTARLAQTQLWQENLASPIRSGLFSRVFRRIRGSFLTS
jgi:hypothetical protein